MSYFLFGKKNKNMNDVLGFSYVAPTGFYRS